MLQLWVRMSCNGERNEQTDWDGANHVPTLESYNVAVIK